MSTWSVEEQNISTAGLEGQITSINLRVGNDASKVIMELAGDPGHTITFDRNGAVVSIVKNEPPKEPEEPPAPEPVAAPAEEEEHNTSSRHGRRR